MLGDGRNISLIGNVVYLSLVHNTGAAFGILASGNLMLTILGVVASVFLLILSGRITSSRLGMYSIALLSGGVLGNLLDRIRLGHVIDFIASSFWPTFNLADIALTIGCILLAIELLRKEPSRSASNSF